jgi:hypothetical protein
MAVHFTESLHLHGLKRYIARETFAIIRAALCSEHALTTVG